MKPIQYTHLEAEHKEPSQTGGDNVEFLQSGLLLQPADMLR